MLLIAATVLAARELAQFEAQEGAGEEAASGAGPRPAYLTQFPNRLDRDTARQLSYNRLIPLHEKDERSLG